jgi:hypothetical protein
MEKIVKKNKVPKLSPKVKGTANSKFRQEIDKDFTAQVDAFINKYRSALTRLADR